MSEPFLLVGSDDAWLEAVHIELEDSKLEAITCRTASAALAALSDKPDGHFAAAIISAFLMPDPGSPTPWINGYPALTLGISLRGVRLGIPLLFVTPVFNQLLSDYVRGAQPAATVADERPDTLCAALSRLRSSTIANVPASPRHSVATIEIEVDVEHLIFVAAVDGTEQKRLELSWAGRSRLRRLNDEFVGWRLLRAQPGQPPRPADDWARKISLAGRNLSEDLALIGEAQIEAVERCLRQVSGMDHIHFRFSVRSRELEQVPFDLVWDHQREIFIRQIAPVARRTLLTDRNLITLPGSQPPNTAALTGRTLFIRSDAHGSLKVDGVFFHNEPIFTPNPLQHLDAEWEGLVDARSSTNLSSPQPLIFERGCDAVAELERKCTSGTWDIVHFAGHSVCSDDGEVFLLLPGKSPGTLVPLPAAAFARIARIGGARLVILSSCESSSPDMVFRLAQEGIPLAIGFRWEVDDAEAAEFTTFLHRFLTHGDPVGRAYLRAVQELRTRHVSSPTFASPMLVVQQETWAQ